MKNNKLVSVIIPCLNEEKNILRCLKSIFHSTYNINLIEVLVIDGKSNDNTLKIISDYKRKTNFNIIILHNELRQQNLALNIGIKNANGDVILRLDAHASLNKNYIEESVNFLFSINPSADAVGAPITTVPQNRSVFGKGIAIVMSSRFGVGNSSFRTNQDINNNQFVETDTIPYGCYKKEIFDEIGHYNEELFCTEDLDFHYRMLKAGKKIFLNNKILNTYHSRTSLASFINHTFRNGRWSILPISITGNNIFSLRHLIPLIFTSSIILLSILSLKIQLVLALLLLEILLYISIAVSFSIANSIKHKNLFLLFILPILYFSLHFFYGLGSISALNSLLKIKK